MTKLCTWTNAGPGYADPDRARQEAERRRDEEDRWTPATLLPPEAFNNTDATRRDFEWWRWLVNSSDSAGAGRACGTGRE